MGVQTWILVQFGVLVNKLMGHQYVHPKWKWGSPNWCIYDAVYILLPKNMYFRVIINFCTEVQQSTTKPKLCIYGTLDVISLNIRT